ncbi:hypothetical protein SERLA73DRAFT_70493 [Serpula lacrymans var. lacrymans S7.3]|uniref:Uncharacterized protein n=1 Tax=Serpula lacrymans var. lacrymans (strain S7.3) TaxID=936435 RepID=F8PN47_SERL3|nr:hypothetical protein SERLA73DRAFT_70493 [Serpula lacrymans var. lacrymans S7.3]
MASSPYSTPVRDCTAVPLAKRTPSRASLPISYSARKRRRMSVPSSDFSPDLNFEDDPEALQDSPADRFIPSRPNLAIPLNTTPRTNRIAKSFGLVDDRILNYSVEGSSSSPDAKVYSLLRKSASELFHTPLHVSMLSAKANLGKRKQFLLALDGPGIPRDRFASPMAWSSTNCIAVACKCDVYYQNLNTRAIVRLCGGTADDGLLHSIDWAGPNRPNTLALGTVKGTIQLWDSEERKQIVAWPRSGKGMGGMNWYEDLLAVGRQDGCISLFDARSEGEVLKLEGHKGKVHGIKWHANGKYMATGDNSGSHGGPVKALAWCPWKSDMIATGGSSPDGTIQIWSINTPLSTPYPEPLHQISLYTSVSSLHWSPHCKELLSTHGSTWAPSSQTSDPSQLRAVPSPLTNSLTVHSYPSCERILSVTAHHGIVAHGCTSPDGCSIFTLSPSEENIKMYKVWSAPGEVERKQSSFDKCTIR